MRTGQVVAGLLVALVASPAWAEVSDKIQSLEAMWAWAVGFNLAAFLLSLWRSPIGIVVVPVAAFYAWAGHEMVSDPHVGPAILQERGAGYVEQVYASGAVGVIGPLLIAALIAAYRQRYEKRRAA